MTLVDAPVRVEASLEHKTIRISGRMGTPPSAPGITKLIADKIITYEAIANRAFEIFYSGANGSDNDNWLCCRAGTVGI
jgi:hypothetical protein